MGHGETFFESHSDDLLKVGFAVKSYIDGDGGSRVCRLEPHLPVHFRKFVIGVAVLVGEGDFGDKAFPGFNGPEVYAAVGGGLVVGTEHGVEPDAACPEVHTFCLGSPGLGGPPFVEEVAVCPGLPDAGDGCVEEAGDEELFA